MDLDTASFSRFENQIVAIDAHVAGEPIRLVIGGLPPIPGPTVNDKRVYIMDNLDYVRLLLTQEPRGHRNMFGAIITEPASQESHFGIVFMDAGRYPYMCGHGTIGAVTMFIEMGWVPAQEPETVVRVDTPSGTVHAHARVRRANGRPRVESVAIQLESAFVYLQDQPLEVPGLGRLAVDVCSAGGFFVLVAAEQIGMTLIPENAPQLAHWGMAILKAGNQQLRVQDPERAYMNTIDTVEFYDPAGHAQTRGKNIVVLGQGHVDRSPCGTGTSAKMALLHQRGELAVGQTFINEGLLGTCFEGRIVGQTTVGKLPAIVPEVCGTAYVTGLHRFVLTSDDPFPEGFLI